MPLVISGDDFLFVSVRGFRWRHGRDGAARAKFSLQRETELPWGTFASNLLGCLVMGAIAQLIASTAWFNDAGVIPDQYRLLFAVGFCGSFTTLSAMVLELNAMMQRNEIFYSFSYLVGTLLGGFACFYVGIVFVRTMLR